MKKKIIALLMMTVLIISLMPSAFAVGESRAVTLEPCTAGTQIMLPITGLAEGEQAVVDYLPSGCTLTIQNGTLYLTGTPMFAGTETFAVNTANGGLLCTVEIDAAVPSVWLNGGDVTVVCGSPVTLSAGASTPDAGSLSYQWYNDSGIAIVGANSASFSPDTGYAGSGSFYCVVTNDNNGRTKNTVSQRVTVTVIQPVVDSITIDSLPFTTEFKVGDNIDVMGLGIKVRYQNGSTATLTDGFNVSPAVFSVAGRQTVTIEYMGKKCTYQVNVKGSLDNVLGIGVVTLPEKTKYKVGDKPETEGLSIRVYTENGTQDITEGFEVSPKEFTQSGKQNVTVTFAGKKCTFEVTVEKKADTTTVSVIQMPDKLEYVKGERLDTTGLVLRVADDEGSREVSDGFSCTPKVLTSIGTQQIRVIYGQYSASFNVSVKDSKDTSPTSPPAPAVTVSPVVVPTSLPVVTGSAQQTQSHASSGNALMVVVVIAAVLALCALGAYVYIMQRRGQR